MTLVPLLFLFNNFSPTTQILMNLILNIFIKIQFKDNWYCSMVNFDHLTYRPFCWWCSMLTLFFLATWHTLAQKTFIFNKKDCLCYNLKNVNYYLIKTRYDCLWLICAMRWKVNLPHNVMPSSKCHIIQINSNMLTPLSIILKLIFNKIYGLNSLKLR